MTSQVPESSTGLPPRLAAVLAFGGWWVTGLIFWLVAGQGTFVRFHAAQSVAAFGLTALIAAGFGSAAVVSLSVLPTAFSLFIWAAGLTWLAGMLIWAAALWQAAHGRMWRMPLAGQLAERMVSGGKES